MLDAAGSSGTCGRSKGAAVLPGHTCLAPNVQLTPAACALQVAHFGLSNTHPFSTVLSLYSTTEEIREKWVRAPA